jgi:uncharacterized 2Fe-2S/4Fe-4S cluster protein (DUF4445 family)
VRLEDNLVVVKPECSSSTWEVAIDITTITCDSLDLDSEAVCATKNTVNCMLVFFPRFIGISPITEKNTRRF